MATPIQNNALDHSIRDLSGANFLARFLPKLIGFGFVVGAIIFFFMFVVGAIQWIVSGGDKVKLENARGKITHALVGLLILFAVFAIIRFIGSFLCINILQIDIGPLEIDSTSLRSVFGTAGCTGQEFRGDDFSGGVLPGVIDPKDN